MANTAVPLNGSARIGIVFVVIGCGLTVTAGLWALGLMNHGHRDYGWILVGALVVATLWTYDEVTKKRGDLKFLDLLQSLVVSYTISTVGLAVVGAYSDKDVMAGLLVAGILLAPILLGALVLWIFAGFFGKSTTP